MSNQTKLKKTLNILFRIIIVLLTWGYITRQILHERENHELIWVLQDIAGNSRALMAFILVLVMMVLNWGIESLKWQFVIGKIEKIPFLRSVQAVLTGVSVSSFTPNRIGEYFGRAFILDKASHMEGILITILSSMSQLLITILTGTIAGIILIPGFFIPYIHPYSYFYYLIILLLFFLDALLLLLYFNVPVLITLRDRLLKGKRMEKVRKFFDVFSKFSFSDLLKLILFSLVRYSVFTIQYFILLRVFSVDIPFFNALLFISLIFLVISVIPTVFLTELGVRDSVALFLFGIYFSKTGAMTDEARLGILMASTLLWVINLAIPALIGTFFTLRLKFFRKLNHTDNRS